MARSIARELTLQILYALACGGEGTAAEIWSMTAPAGDKPNKRNLRKADDMAERCHAMWEQLDGEIGPLLQSWTLDRLDRVDLCILRLACFEMLHYDETPVPVAINEAVELAKLFSSDDSPGFVNGVLGALAREGPTHEVIEVEVPPAPETL